MVKSNLLNRLFPRKDGFYLVLLVEFTLFIALLGAVPGYLSIQANAELNKRQMEELSNSIPVLTLLSLLVLLYISWRITPKARKRLDEHAAASITSNSGEELAAWREITSLPWRYALAMTLTCFVLIILPAFLITASQSDVQTSPFQPGSMNSPTPIYIFLGGTASLLGSVILVVLLLDRFTLPLRSILLPIEFEAQLKGRAGASINGRFLSLILTLMAIGVLLIAPIGYRQTVDVRYGGIDSLDVFREVQSQTILFGLLTLLFGAVYSYYLTKSVSDPLKELISSFDKIENSDLSVRLPVSGTDELGVVTMQFNRMVSRLEELRNSLEQQESKRTRRLAAMYEVGRAASSSLDPNELLARVIKVFTEQFNYYHAAIYLLDPSEKWAELKEASGEASSILKQNHHRLEVSGRSLVGSAIREKSARIVAIASGEKQRFDNPLLPRTRSEIALPLIAGNRVQGALNIQSSKESDFRPEIIETMQNMANQVAIALDNARLFQDAQQNIREMRAIQQQYQLTGWSSFSESDEALEYGVGDESGDPAKKIDVSISLRDQVLGQIQLESNLEWTPEKESLVNAVATQAAIALENARLVSESRQIAVRERMLTDINSKIWASATIEGVLQTVAKELGRHLDASRATVELNMDENS